MACRFFLMTGFRVKIYLLLNASNWEIIASLITFVCNELKQIIFRFVDSARHVPQEFIALIKSKIKCITALSWNVHPFYPILCPDKDNNYYDFITVCEKYPKKLILFLNGLSTQMAWIATRKP